MTEKNNYINFAETIGVSERTAREVFTNSGFALLEAIHRAFFDDDVPDDYYSWGLKLQGRYSWQWTIPKVFYNLRKSGLLDGTKINYEKAKEVIFG